MAGSFLSPKLQPGDDDYTVTKVYELYAVRRKNSLQQGSRTLSGGRLAGMLLLEVWPAFQI